jgi:hypothetical protein
MIILIIDGAVRMITLMDPLFMALPLLERFSRVVSSNNYNYNYNYNYNSSVLIIIVGYK